MKSTQQLAIEMAEARGAVSGLRAAARIADSYTLADHAASDIRHALQDAERIYQEAHAAWVASCAESEVRS